MELDTGGSVLCSMYFANEDDHSAANATNAADAADADEASGAAAGDGSPEGDDERVWQQLESQIDWGPIRELLDPLLDSYTARTSGSDIRYLTNRCALR